MSRITTTASSTKARIAKKLDFRYNTMMLTILTAAVLGLSQPQVLAYLTPEEVLLREQSSFYSLPDPYLTPNPRRVRSITEELAQERMDKYKETQQIPLHAAAEESSSSEGAALEETETSSEAGGTARENAGLTPAEIRLLERYDRRGITNSVLSHQSAPLTPTGPEAYATVAVMLGTVGWTVYRAKKAKGWRGLW